MNSIITEKFNQTKSDQIAKELTENGYCLIEKAITDEAVDKMLIEAESIRLRGNINVNDIQLVDYNGQDFIAHTLASMETVAKLVVNEKILDIGTKFLGKNMRLKAQRYYESGSGYQLGWHVDNKTVNNVKTNTRGLVFILYLVDTYDGQLEVIKGSNKWSRNLPETSFKESELKENFGAHDFLSLPAPKGSIVITDIYTIHQTKKIHSNFRRKSIFLQIDDDMFHSEKIILNPEFFPNLSLDLQKYLGFGLPQGYKIMPTSSPKTLTLKSSLSNIKILLSSIIFRAMKRIYTIFKVI